MSFKEKYVPYSDTGFFSKMVIDYLGQVPALRKFYEHEVNLEGIRKAIECRQKNLITDRKILVSELKKDYSKVVCSPVVKANLDRLLANDTFTVCTAHQPNIFTGHLYFVYKIMHAIKLAEELKTAMPSYDFVPVYYMGSEDADLEELGEVVINGKKYTWNTKQKGAVGRMKIDNEFLSLVASIEGQLTVEKYGNEILTIVRKVYTLDKTIERATFELVNELFGEFGLVILMPDSAAFKKPFMGIIQKELQEGFSQPLVAETILSFPEDYKVQAAGREINLFYLKDDIRERIESNKDGYSIANTSIVFTKEQMTKELSDHPERFSPNVILRPLFQELLLPDVAFIGGGGELSYWLELKKLFESVNVPYPVLILRNSFMFINKKQSVRLNELGFSHADIFKPADQLLQQLVKKRSKIALELNPEKQSLTDLYKKISNSAAAADITLEQHVDALKTQSLKRIQELEKKMLNAEKKKFEAQQRQIIKIREALFPLGVLQERV
ncbi:MAG: bacillithiol biosynthesis cysteine-adding enzyme BshC, partial [Ferruginibacter sp.]